jgi:hypothetical protein
MIQNPYPMISSAAGRCKKSVFSQLVKQQLSSMYFLIQFKYYAPKLIPVIILLNVFLMSTVLEVEEGSEKESEKKSEKESEKDGQSVKANFYMEGSQNIDLKDFKLLINNNICDEKEIKIITIVSTAIENKAGIQI